MKRKVFHTVIPIGLIIIGVGLWTKTLVFNEPTNHVEAQIFDFWEKDAKQGIQELIRENQDLKNWIDLEIFCRVDDTLILQNVDDLWELQEVYLEKFEHQSQSKAYYRAQYQAYHNQITASFKAFGLEKKYINEQDIEDIIDRLLSPDQLRLQTNPINNSLMLQHLVLLSINTLLAYHKSQLGSTSVCFTKHIPALQFFPTLKKGQTSIGQLYLSHGLHTCHCTLPHEQIKEMEINGKVYPLKSKRTGISINTVFEDSRPKKFDVVSEMKVVDLEKNQKVERVVTTNETFIIQPFEN